MLINYVDANLSHTTSYNATWQSQLKTRGYPQQTRNIALSNASHCAETQGLTSNELIADITFDGGTDTLVDLVLFVTGLGSLVGDFFDDSPTFLLGFLPGKTSLEGDFQAKAFPSTGTANIYYGKLTYEKTLLWLVPIRRTLSQRTFNSVGNLFLDNYPGGVNPVGSNFMGSDYESGVLGYYNYDVSFNPNFDFIPATSALDVGSGNTTLLPSDYLKVYSANNPPTGSKTIPFVNFMTSFNTNNINEPHISFNSFNGDWLAEELDSDSTIDIFDCLYVCDNIFIIGDSQLCGSGTYSIDTSAPNVSWSKVDRNNLATLNSNYGNQITISQNDPSKSGSIRLTATYGNSDCGTRSSTMTVYLGKPDAYTIDSGGNKNYMGGGFYFPQAFGSTGSFSVFSDTPNTTFTWSGPSNLNWWNTNNNTVEFYLNQSGNYFFTATATNGCATHPYFVSVNIGGTGPDPMFRVAPNPVKTNTLIVQDISSDSKNSKNINKTANTLSEDVTLTLYDFNGHVVQTKTLQRGSAGKEYRLDVSGLKNRNYFVKITCGTIEETYQIILNK